VETIDTVPSGYFKVATERRQAARGRGLCTPRQMSVSLQSVIFDLSIGTDDPFNVSAARRRQLSDPSRIGFVGLLLGGKFEE